MLEFTETITQTSWIQKTVFDIIKGSRYEEHLHLLGDTLVKVIQVKLQCKFNDSVHYMKIATHIVETFLAICTANQETISKCSDTNERTFNTSI